ncbi:o-succinylbenzoate synthase [Devriesea agamarum]|uniref:o-succinylbenzoate synthase n=1 Tax=Devriesea agamarum TaxID=472569 RepID=UPI00071E52B4|nr:o-succinylbenzoate synthase [Devriesea agamarum]
MAESPARLTVPPTLREQGIDDAICWSIPMTTRFRRITVRDGVLLKGPAGWGEFSPFWDYDPPESSAWLRAALEVATSDYPRPLRDRVGVNVTVPVVSAECAAQLVASSSCRTAKVKVADPGTSLDQDVERVAAVRDALGPGGMIRVDANAAWDVPSAVDAIRRLDRAANGLDYVEQPCPTQEDLAAVRRLVNVPIAADELVRRVEDPLRIARSGAADLLIMKVQPLGGVRRCLELAEQAGLPVVVSSALESTVGLDAGIALAASLPGTAHDGGLGTIRLFTGDLVSRSAIPTGGMLEVPATRACPNPGLLARFAADPNLRSRWQHRLDACAALL